MYIAGKSIVIPQNALIIEEWNRTFGGSDYDYGCSVTETSDGSYLVVGNTMSYGAGDWDVWLIKTDTTETKSGTKLLVA